MILDYGCGPGNDLTGFAINTGARRLIGFDVSQTALDLAAKRLELHGVDASASSCCAAPTATRRSRSTDASVDHVNCQGVIHHTSHPEAILAEFARVLRPGGTATIMVYNRDSIWLHLYTAYERMIVEGAFAGLDVEEAFARNTDGPECPISRCYAAEEFLGMCRGAGLDGYAVGGYLSVREMQALEASWHRALADDRLPAEHREFLRELTFDFSAFPMYRGRHAGIGGTFRLHRP